MIDAVHDHDTVLIENLVHDLVRAASSGVQTGQLALQRRADPLGIVNQRAEHELHDRRGGSLGETVDEIAAQVLDASPLLPPTQSVPSAASSEVDPLTAFLGCVGSGDRRGRVLQELRDELSDAQLTRPA